MLFLQKCCCDVINDSNLLLFLIIYTANIKVNLFGDVYRAILF